MVQRFIPSSTNGARAADQSGASRNQWVDAARGIGIVLVVYGHALRSLFVSPVSRPAWVVEQDRIIYAFHMPLFFILAGMWMWDSLGRGRSDFIKARVITVLYPYFIWSIFEGLIELAFARYANSPLSWRDILMIPISPIEQYWFLYALFFAQVFVSLAYPKRALVPIVALLSFSWILHGYFAVVTFYQICSATLYVSIGCFVAPWLKNLDGRSSLMISGIGIVAWVCFAIILVTIPSNPSQSLTAVAAVAGSAGTCSIAVLSTRLGNRWLQTLGRGSLAIYVMHTIASAASRTAIHQAGIQIPVVWTLLIISGFGLLAPLVAWRLLGRFGNTKLLGLPTIPRRLVSS